MEVLRAKQAVALKNLLLATDFSQVSEHALFYAAGIAQRHGSKVYVVHVIPHERPLPGYPFPAVPDRSRSEAEADLDSVAHWEPLEHIPHELLLEEGPIWQALSRIIEDKEIDLLVVGTHGRGGFKKIVIGSVAEELFRLAPCPVLTVGPEVRAKVESAGEIRRILFTTDFGTASLNALPYAIALANESQAQLTLLHVLAPMPVLDVGPYWYVGTDVIERQEKNRANCIEQLRQLIPSRSEPVRDLQFLVGFGFVPDVIVKTAAEQQASLIVLGVNQVALVRVSAHVPWAIAHEVVCHAKCPVLTIKG
ncbi:MAG TPA: universal stress protein [Terriglobales bacterium]|nr:universal stress protein [Terriglobales bacterium]